MKKIIYLLIGDSFLVEEKEKSLIGGIDREGSLARQVVRSGEISLAEWLSEQQTLSLWGGAQALCVRGAERLKEADWLAIKAFIKKPPPNTYLFVSAEDWEPGSEILSFVRAAGEVFIFSRGEKKSVAAAFIQNKLRYAGKQMSPGARARLDREVGEMPAFLDTVLNQLIAYSGEKDEINEEAFEHFGEKLMPVDVFQLINAVSSGDLASGLRLLKDFLDENGKDLVSLIGLFHWQLRRLWQARLLMDEGAAQEAVLKICRVSPRQSGAFLKQVRSLGREKLEQAIENLFDLDRDIKTGRADGPQGLENFAIRLMM